MFDIIIPAKNSDINHLKLSIPYLQRNIKPKSIIVITKLTDFQDCNWINQYKNVELLDEDGITNGLTFKAVEKYFSNRFNNTTRVGWYFQQFIKMAYCYISHDDSYLLWDADTIPLHPIEFQVDGKYYLDVKDEFHEPYFHTLKSILSLNKEIDKSFIAEHMIINKYYMQELIELIMKKESLKGGLFFERILNAISDADMFPSGFSEYETYGTFINRYHHDTFELRRIKSLRLTRRIFGDCIDDELISWVANTSEYSIISIENSQRASVLTPLCNNYITRKVFSAQFIISCWLFWVIDVFDRK